MMYDVRMIHRESGAVAHLSVRAPNDFEARARAWEKLAGMGYGEPNAAAWRIFSITEWPDAPRGKEPTDA